MPSPFDQSAYQVRLDWGSDGLDRLAPADVVVVVDVLRFSSTVADAVAGGAEVPLSEAPGWARDGAALAAAAAATGATVFVGALRNASAVARAVQAVQERRQERTFVSVIAVGGRDDAGRARFAVEDQLGAGAVVAALSDLGLDHTAPDAAVAAEGFHALRGALRHLLSASGSARELAAGGEGAEDAAASPGLVPTATGDAAVVDALDVVPVLRDGRFTPFS